MEKTFTINISGQIFNINESAYIILEKYLNALKAHFTKIEGGDEIIIDIEMRIAELLNEKLQKQKVVVNKSDINDIISILGELEDFIDSDDQEKDTSHKKEQEKNKQLYRDVDDNVFGGVARGLAYYLGVNVIFVRLAFIVLLFAFTSGFWIYIILWFVIPEAKTSVQKLEMKGEPINISNIEKSIKEEFEKVKNDLESGKITNKLSDFAIKIKDIIVLIITAIFKFTGKTIGLIFIIFSVFLISLLVSNFSIDLFPLEQFVDIIFVEQNTIFVIISIFAVIFFPLIILLYVGLKQIFRIETGYKTFLIIALVFWMFSIVFLGLNTANIGADFKEQEFVENEYVLPELDTVYVQKNNVISDIDYSFSIDDELFLNKNKLFLETRIKVITHNEPNVLIKVKYRANGKNSLEANKMIKSINFEFNIDSNIVNYDSHYDFENKWRNQDVILYIYKPYNTKIIYR